MARLMVWAALSGAMIGLVFLGVEVTLGVPRTERYGWSYPLIGAVAGAVIAGPCGIAGVRLVRRH